MKKLYFGSNLKMYKGISATREYLQKLVENTKDISRDDIELFIIPSYTTLQTATSCCNREFVTAFTAPIITSMCDKHMRKKKLGIYSDAAIAEREAKEKQGA